MKIKLNNEISVGYPESFAEMTGAELKKSFGSAARRSGAKNDAKQFFISVSWTDRVSLPTSLFVNEKSCLNKAAARCRRTLSEHRDDGHITREHPTGKVTGFEYSYTQDGTPYHGAAAAIKLCGRIYVVEYRTSSFDRMFCSMAFNMVITSLRPIRGDKR